METAIGNEVHPRYKNYNEWKVADMVHLDKPVEYHDSHQGDVVYDPAIVQLEASAGCRVFLFNYRISSDETGSKMKWGGGPPVLEEYVLLELLKNAVDRKLFSEDFLQGLAAKLNSIPLNA